MRKDLSDIYRSKLKQEADTFFKTSLWAEIVKGLFELRAKTSRALETCPLKDQEGLWKAAKYQGQIDGHEDIIRLIHSILDVQALPGLENFRGI